ncbi:MAG: hypothetical protein ACE5KM_03150 [Planctomycetaceae bacterium]
MTTAPVEATPSFRGGLVRMLIGPESMGFTFSVLLHTLMLLVMALWVFDLTIPIEELLISGSSKVGIQHDLLESPEISLTAAGGELKAERLVPPSALLPPTSPDFELPAGVKQAVEKVAVEGAGNDDKQGDGNDDDGKAKAPTGGSRRTANAVTKGSFTAWTVPEKPVPRKPYYVIIEVRVPKKFGTRYKADDLAGIIRGNESKFGFDRDYRQRIPWDDTLKKLGGPTYRRHTFRIGARDKWIWLNPRARYKIIPVIGGRAKIAIKVPGADVPRIKDTITIRSKLLKEKQTLEIVF